MFPMFRHAAAICTKPLVLPAPCLILGRDASSSPSVLLSKHKYDSRPQPSLADFPLESTDPAMLFNKLQKRISLLNPANQPGPSESEVGTFNQTISSLRQALRTHDLRLASNYWSLLHEKNLLRFMGPPQLESYSRLLATACFSIHRDEVWPWDANTERFVKEIALLAASRGATEALNALLMLHIKGKNPTYVIELYQSYVELSEGKEVWEGSGREDDEDSLASTSVTVHIPQNPGRVHIVLAVLAAHAMQGSFHEALRMFLSSRPQFNRYTVKTFLEGLDQFPDLQEKVEQYSRDLATARKIAEPAVLLKRIVNLAKSPYHLERLYDSVIDGLTKPGAYIAATQSAVSSEKPILMPEAGWSTFLNTFIKCRRLDLAEKLWDDMSELGITPAVSVWTALFNGYDEIRAVDETLMCWQSMLEQGTQPDANAYRALISALFNGHRPVDAVQRFAIFKQERFRREMEHVQGKQNQCHPFTDVEVVTVYNAVIHGLLWHSETKNPSRINVLDSSRRNWASEANDLLKEMVQTGPKPDIVTYNTILRYHGRRGDIKSINLTLQRIMEAGLVADVFTYTTLLSALLKAGRDDAPELVMAHMRKHGVEPNVATYTTIIDQQIRDGDEGGIRTAFKMLKRMEQEPHLRPNQVTFTTVLAAIHRGGMINRRDAEECRQYITAQMKARKMRLDRTTYNILLVACLEDQGFEGLRRALNYYREMVRQSVPMSNETRYILLHGLVEREEWAIADEIVNEMNKNEALQTGGPLWKLIEAVRTRTWRKRKTRWSPGT